jgi:hypothetical protein
VAAIGITFLTPQLDRFGGHFNLSYVAAIPIMIWLLIRFFKKPSFLITLAIFLTVMAGALTHFYHYGFYGVLILFFFASHLIHPEEGTSRTRLLVHLFLQLILPFLILQAFYISDHVTDRPGYPWGFLYYRAYPQSVFLPLNMPYGQFLRQFIPTGQIDWEGYAYSGFVAVAALLAAGVLTAGKILRGSFSSLLRVTPSRSLNILFWASLAALIYSFGIPFILGMEWLADLIGPVRQMRGICRFSWLFFYNMNLIAIYGLWTFHEKHRKLGTGILLFLVLLILCTEAYFNVRHKGQWLENHVPALVDRKLTEPDNQWIHRVPLSNYQAIIPLPYYHVGSENIWIDGGCDIVTQNFIGIDRSGLPSVGVMLSRTSISQTIANVAMMLEPSRTSTDMSRFPLQKPFLLMAIPCDVLKPAERNLIAHSRAIDSTDHFVLYEAPLRVFREIYDSLSRSVSAEFHNPSLYRFGNLYSTDSVKNFMLSDFDNLNNPEALAGKGFFTGPARDANVVFSAVLPMADTANMYTASFWLGNADGDLVPRSLATLVQTDPQGKEVSRETFQVFRNFRMIDGKQVLVEWSFRLSNPLNRVTLSVTNPTLKKQNLYIDAVLIRPENVHVYQDSKEGLVKDNRIFTHY